ncbi:MAG TPA: hypothetical protein VJN01_03250, partial [Xanthomonadales bacterium]|nr:hypothetical protein [Xanthomonadales bacterium]
STLFPSSAGLLLAAALLLSSAPAESQSRMSAESDCAGDSVNSIHFDQTIYQADFKIMVSEYEAEPDIRIRLVNQPALADLIFADDLASPDFAVCRSSTRYQSTTLFVAKFVTQPDVVIMLNRDDRHADYTLYVDSEIVSNDQAAALFWLAWKQNSAQALE